MWQVPSPLPKRKPGFVLTPLIDKETKALAIDWEDEIVLGVAITRDGAVIHPSFAPKAPEPEPDPASEPSDDQQDDPSST